MEKDFMNVGLPTPDPRVPTTRDPFGGGGRGGVERLRVLGTLGGAEMIGQ